MLRMASNNWQELAITWYGVGTLCQVNGNINAEKYISVLDSQLRPVIACHFSDDSYVLLHDIAEFS
jgi:hypothetical protein